MYRDIWANQSDEPPQVGDFVLHEYGERGVVLDIGETMIAIGVFRDIDQLVMFPRATFPRRWSVCR